MEKDKRASKDQEKKEFAVGTSNYHPHPTPDPLPLAFQVIFRTFQFTHHSDSGIFRERRVGKGQNTPETKANLIRRKQCRISRPHSSEITKDRLEAPSLSDVSWSSPHAALEDLGVLSEGSGLLLLHMRVFCSLSLTSLL